MIALPEPFTKQTIIVWGKTGKQHDLRGKWSIMIYIVDRDQATRANLSSFLRSENFVVHPCSSGSELLTRLEYVTPGCILLDVRIPVTSGLDVITDLQGHRARLPVIAMCSSFDVTTAVGAMKAGAVDVIEKPIDQRVLLGALENALVGLDDHVRDFDRRASASERLAALTAREHDVLRGLTAGRSNKLLAHDFGISIRTVEMHRASMMERLGVRTLAEALRIAFEGALQAGVRRAA